MNIIEIFNNEKPKRYFGIKFYDFYLVSYIQIIENLRLLIIFLNTTNKMTLKYLKKRIFNEE